NCESRSRYGRIPRGLQKSNTFHALDVRRGVPDSICRRTRVCRHRQTKTHSNHIMTPESYIAQAADDKREALSKLRDTIIKNLPSGFQESIGYNMLCYVVPKSTYPAGY